MSRTTIDSGRLAETLSAVNRRLMKTLAEKGSHSLSSTHEILGVMHAEMIELAQAVETNDWSKVRHEIMDVAVAAVFGIACLDAGTLDW